MINRPQYNVFNYKTKTFLNNFLFELKINFPKYILTQYLEFSLYIQMFIFILNFTFSQITQHITHNTYNIPVVRLNTPIDEKIFNVFSHLLKQDWRTHSDVYFIVSRLSNIPLRILAYYEKQYNFFAHSFVVISSVWFYF